MALFATPYGFKEKEEKGWRKLDFAPLHICSTPDLSHLEGEWASGEQGEGWWQLLISVRSKLQVI